MTFYILFNKKNGFFHFNFHSTKIITRLSLGYFVFAIYKTNLEEVLINNELLLREIENINNKYVNFINQYFEKNDTILDSQRKQ